MSIYSDYKCGAMDDVEFHNACVEENARERDLIPSDGKYPFTPCDFEGDDGHYHCPYLETYSGYEDEMCRVCCGIGVDE